MRRLIVLVCAVLIAVAGSVAAQNTIKILTPNDDRCSSFIAAMDSGQPPLTVTALGGWALGFLSGVAEGSNRDILRGESAQSVMSRLYVACKRQPNRLLSETQEEIAAALITAHH